MRYLAISIRSSAVCFLVCNLADNALKATQEKVPIHYFPKNTISSWSVNIHLLRIVIEVNREKELNMVFYLYSFFCGQALTCPWERWIADRGFSGCEVDPQPLDQTIRKSIYLISIFRIVFYSGDTIFLFLSYLKYISHTYTHSLVTAGIAHLSILPIIVH